MSLGRVVMQAMKPFLMVAGRQIALLNAIKEYLEREFIDHAVLVDPGPFDLLNTAMNAIVGRTIFVIDQDLGEISGIEVAKILKRKFRYGAEFLILIKGDDHTSAVEAVDADFQFFCKDPPPEGEPYNLGGLLKALVLSLERKLNKDTLDLLTGVYTRRQALEIWKKDFLQVQKKRLTVGYVFADLNYFGLINKVIGDHEGDLLLAKFAECLRRSVLTSDDIICRQGGDEFLVILVNVTRAEVLRFIQNVEGYIANIHVTLEGLPVPLSAALGHSLLRFENLQSDDPHEVLKHGARLAARNMRIRKRAVHAEILSGPYGDGIQELIRRSKALELEAER
ncbi:MAG: hypothetical protein RIQ41_576 [Candidatus Parcubacteria bacterium]